MSFGGSGKKGAVNSAINITPLVDVVLVLLIIFMVLTPILLKQMEVKVPQKDTQVDVAPPVTSGQIILRIESDGRLLLDHEPVPRDLLSDRVATIFANRREKVLFFDVDDAANYGLVVEVMDTCRGAGVKVLGIMTRS
jgi:biopolymer transport protein ExbD